VKIRCVIREAALGYGLFTTKELHAWKSSLEDLGKLHGEAWRDDLPEEDRAWAEACREEFRQWVDGRPAPLWPMLLAAVKRAFLSFLEALEREPTSEGERLSRLSRTYLWKTLNADDIAQGHGPEALRAFQRGFRLGHRGRPSSMKRNIPPMLDPPWLWEVTLKGSVFPGPTAARERALRASWRKSQDLKEREALKQALSELYASAWREDVPDEDCEWAKAYREECTNWIDSHRRDAVAQVGYEAYLQSSDGILDGERAPPRPMRGCDSKPWKSFAERVEDAPEDESELATAEAAAREYWDTRWQEAPPWDSDPAQTHWLAAVRAARKTSAALANHVWPPFP
jgi:hypothetical protein